jgi:CHASE3 domain sensor protein
MRFEDDYQEAKILLLRDLKKLVRHIENNKMETEHIRKVHNSLEVNLITVDEYYDYIWE